MNDHLLANTSATSSPSLPPSHRQAPPRSNDTNGRTGKSIATGMAPGSSKQSHSQVISKPHTGHSYSKSDINILSDCDNGPSSQPPLIDRSFISDPWRPDDYTCLVTHKGRSLDDDLPDVSTLSWTRPQSQLFGQVLSLLESNRLARLVFQDSDREFLLTRVQIEKTSEKLRKVFAYVQWDSRLLQWLNVTLLDLLPRELLMVWIDMIRYLYTHCTHLFDVRGLLNINSSDRFRHNNELLATINTPLFPDLSHTDLQEFTFPKGDPLFILVPGDSPWTNEGLPSQLASLGRVICLDHQLDTKMILRKDRYQTISAIVIEALLAAREQSPKTPVVLIGHMIGARIACQVAAAERVHAVVCLGYPLKTLADNDDILTQLRGTPILFLVGASSIWCPLPDMERNRRMIRGQSAMLQVIPGADDSLMADWKYQRMGTTQSSCDRKTYNEVGAFLQMVLAKPFRRQSGTRAPGTRKRKVTTDGDIKVKVKRPRTPSNVVGDGDGTTTQGEGGEGEAVISNPNKSATPDTTDITNTTYPTNGNATLKTSQVVLLPALNGHPSPQSTQPSNNNPLSPRESEITLKQNPASLQTPDNKTESTEKILASRETPCIPLDPNQPQLPPLVLPQSSDSLGDLPDTTSTPSQCSPTSTPTMTSSRRTSISTPIASHLQHRSAWLTGPRPQIISSMPLSTLSTSTSTSVFSPINTSFAPNKKMVAQSAASTTTSSSIDINIIDDELIDVEGESPMGSTSEVLLTPIPPPLPAGNDVSENIVIPDSPIDVETVGDDIPLVTVAGGH